MKRGHGHFKAAMAFLAPNLLGFLLFTAGPVIFSLGASFTNWNLQQTVPLRFNGLSNFSELLADPAFWLYFVNTLYMMLGMPFAIFGALWLAILLNRKIKGIGAFRTLLYLPSFASGVALMILWKALFNPDFGPINDSMRHVFAVLHIHSDTPQWLQSTHNLAALNVESVAIDKKQFGIGGTRCAHSHGSLDRHRRKQHAAVLGSTHKRAGRVVRSGSVGWCKSSQVLP